MRLCNRIANPRGILPSPVNPIDVTEPWRCQSRFTRNTIRVRTRTGNRPMDNFDQPIVVRSQEANWIQGNHWLRYCILVISYVIVWFHGDILTCMMSSNASFCRRNKSGGRFHCCNVNDHNCSWPALLTRYLHFAKKDDHRSRYSAFTMPSPFRPVSVRS